MCIVFNLLHDLANQVIEGSNMFLVCHVISQDHVMEESFVYIIRSPSIKSTMYGGHRHCGSGDLMVLVCHVILQRVKGSCDFMGRSPSR